MSATNTTTNYNLPIFIGADKPAWLVDFNGAMNAIDAQMKTNADAIATKSPILTFNDTTDIDFTKSGNIVTASLASGVSDKVGRALVTPIAAPAADQLVGIDTNGAQTAFDIGSGLINDNGTLKAIDLNLTDTGSSSTYSNFSDASITYKSGSLSYALNADGTVGKVYGGTTVGGTGTGIIEFYTGIDVAATGEEYIIGGAGFDYQVSGNYITGLNNIALKVKADGKVYARFYKSAAGNVVLIYIASIYFFKNFGDE